MPNMEAPAYGRWSERNHEIQRNHRTGEEKSCPRSRSHKLFPRRCADRPWPLSRGLSRRGRMEARPGRYGTDDRGHHHGCLQAPAGAIVDQLRSKRLILVVASAVLAAGAVLLSLTAAPWAVYSSQVLIGGAGPFLGPTLAAVTMGVVGVTCFDRQFGKNQSFNSAGNVFCALLIAGVSHLFGNRAIFITAAVLTVPTILAVLAIKSNDIDYDLARGGCRRAGGKEPPLEPP